MKEFLKTRLGNAIITGLTVIIVWSICTPILDFLFDGGIKEFNLFRYIIEPILIGFGVGLLDYIFQITRRHKDKK